MTAKFFLWLMVKIFIIEIISLIRPKMTSRDQDLSFDTNNVMIGQKNLLNLRCNVNVWICRDFFNPGELPPLPYCRVDMLKFLYSQN